MNAVALRQKIPSGSPDVGELLKSIAAPTTEEEGEQDSLHHLWLYNDDYNSFAFVMNVLEAVLGYSPMKCLYLAFRVHITGKGAIWTGALKEAQARAEKIRKAGPDPEGSRRLPPRPLTVTVEPA